MPLYNPLKSPDCVANPLVSDIPVTPLCFY
jgi:hypothetical protein